MRIPARFIPIIALVSISACGGGGGGSSPTTTPPPQPPVGVTVSTTSLTVGEGAEATYTIVLVSAPSGNVTITPASADTGAVTVSGALTFTTSNWNTAQTVTVTGVEENNGDGNDEQVTITHAVSGPANAASSVAVSVDDNDAQANGIYREIFSGEYCEACLPVVLHDGRFVGANQGFLTVTLFNGTYTVDGADISGSLEGWKISLLSVSTSTFETTFSGTVVEHQSVTLSYSLTEDESEVSYEVGYDKALYERPSALSMWEGSWTEYDVDGVATGSLTANADGTIFSQDTDGCTANGNIAVLDAERNLYDLTLEVAACSEFNGTYAGFAGLTDCPESTACEGSSFLAFQSDGDKLPWLKQYERN